MSRTLPEVPIDLVAVQVLLLELPMITTFKTAHGTTTAKQTVIVHAIDRDGTEGWGEAPGGDLPTYSPDTYESAVYALRRFLAPHVVGRRFSGPGEVGAALAEFQGYNMAKHGLECAAWAIASQKSGRSMSDLVGGTRTALEVGESFGIEPTPDLLLEQIADRVAQGFRRIKVKIEPGWDVDILRRVVREYPDQPVMADANAGYRPQDEGPWAALDELGLLMIEQPFAGEALLELAALQSRLRTRVCLDETATTPGVTAAALRLGSGRIVNIKPGRLGGVRNSLAVHDHCAALGVPVWCGGLLETGIGRGFNLAIASLPGFTLPADMSPARVFYAEDLVDPTFDLGPDGLIAVPTALGCGFPVVEDRIRRYQAGSWEVRA